MAGVTIALVVGDNGILNQAVNAADETNRANAQTEFEMAVSAVVTDWSGARYIDGNKQSLEEYLTKEKVEANMNLDEYTLTNFVLNTDEGVTVNYRGKDYKFTVEITSSGNSAKVTYEYEEVLNDSEDDTTTVPEEPVTPEFGEVETYGDYVDYPIDINEDGDTTNDWRIFYSEGDRVFIIAADYVENTSSYLNNIGTGMTTEGIYELYWDTAPSSAQDVSQASLFGQTMWADYNTNANGRCVSTLLNTSNWTGFVDITYGEYAIGGPTIEMWIESYNSKGYTPLYCNNTNSIGYFVGNIDTPTSSSYYLNEDANTGYEDTLYFPYQEKVSDCWGYWLSSPSIFNMNSVIGVSYVGAVGGGIYNHDASVRPLVSLKTEVKANQNIDTGVWKLSI